MRKPRSFSGIEHAIEATARTYRRALWDDTDAYAEIWLEKDALAGVVVDVTEKYDVPLMVARGYSSLSFLYSAAEAMAGRTGHVSSTTSGIGTRPASMLQRRLARP